MALSACGGYNTPAAQAVVAPVTANFLVLSSSASGHLPNAVAGSPYGYGFQTNLGFPGVPAVAPIAWSAKAALPPGLSLSSQGALAGTPSTPGQYTVSIEAVDSSRPTPLTADFVYLMDVRTPGATLTQVAHNALGGAGQNGDVAVAIASANQRAFAYVGTLGRVGECPASGIKIVDLSQITNPQQVASAGGVSGAAQIKARVATAVSAPGFHPGGHGDLMAVTEQPCDPKTVTTAQAGFQLFDVSDPSHPLALGSWSSGVQGVSDVALLAVPGPLTALGQVDHSQDHIYALAAVPTSETSGAGEGDLRVVDVSNPALPVEVRNWGVLAATATPLAQAVQGVDQRVFLDSIELSSDHATAYLAYWDEGVVVLDVRDPLAIASNNPAVLLDHLQYPITSLATSATPSNPEGNTHQALPVLNNSGLL
ncbi:MAG: LVIVD repeat-containing protein, partial [Terriglobales bacterium]